jgi:DNA polymerase III subunit alpha
LAHLRHKGQSMKLPENAQAQCEQLLREFRRQIPDDTAYSERLVEEIEIILGLRFTDYFLQIREILDMTADLPHMTRGSAGSSLVCWALGITDVDPIKWDIPLSRFLNPHRDDLPDIDIDYPHWAQSTVMERIFKRWPGKSARISNYVTFKEKSAKREAARRLGAKGKLPRNFKYDDLDIDIGEAIRIEKKLLGKKRAISKHCGGILVFKHNLPKSLINADNQILLDKHEVEDLEHLKVDILANRGLSQLYEIEPNMGLEDYPDYDEATIQLLCNGDVLGVTQGESPAMRRLFRAIQPKSRSDCVFATALIRPVATTGRQKASFFHDWTEQRLEESIVYEDDAIKKISKLIGCDIYEADMYRRAFAKKNEEKVYEFMHRMGTHPKKGEIIDELYQLGNFGLCRAHAVNLGRLIWALAYQKAHNPKPFWAAYLKHCEGSYRRWVYKNEAKRAGWDLRELGYNYSLLNDPIYEYKKYGWWGDADFLPGFYCNNQYLDRFEFAGLVANGRVFKGEGGKYITFLTLGVGNGKYIDLLVKGPVAYHDYDVVCGVGKVKTSNGSQYIECQNVRTLKLEKFNSSA